VADFDEAFREYMEEKAVDELMGWESNQPGFFWVGVIAGAEGDFAVLAVD
jgi:hypothetical protein